MIATSIKTNNNSKMKFYPTRIDINRETRVGVVEKLTETLATTTDLKSQVKQAHWNVKGSH